MKVCAKGHEYRGDENYRARAGKCPHCFRIVQERYDRSAKGLERRINYNHSDNGQHRQDEYRQSPKGWLNALRNRHARAVTRRKLRNLQRGF